MYWIPSYQPGTVVEYPRAYFIYSAMGYENNIFTRVEYFINELNNINFQMVPNKRICSSFSPLVVVGLS